MNRMLYQNTHGFIEYSSKRSQYTLSLHGIEHTLQFCDFHNIYSKIKSIDIEQILTNTNEEDDFTTFKFLKSNKTFVVNILELLALKDLVEGIVFELYLEDILYRAGVSLPEEVLAY